MNKMSMMKQVVLTKVDHRDLIIEAEEMDKPEEVMVEVAVEVLNIIGAEVAEAIERVRINLMYAEAAVKVKIIKKK